MSPNQNRDVLEFMNISDAKWIYNVWGVISFLQMLYIREYYKGKLHWNDI